LASASATPAKASPASSPSPPARAKSAFFSHHFGNARRAVHGRGGDEDGGLGRVDAGQEFLEVLDELERALGAAGDAVGEEVDVFEPNDPLAAKHRNGLHAFAETI
jgi:hypothetical protein